MFRNTDSPLTLVYLNGNARDLGILSSIRIQQRLSMPDLCELHYRYLQIPDDEDLVGDHLQLDVQLDGTLQTLFEGEITAVEYRYPPVSAGHDAASNLEIVIRAYNLLHRLRKHQRVRSFENISFVQLAREFCKQHGIDKVRVLEDPSAAPWPLLIQHQQTDLEFLVEVAAQAGLYLTLSGGELQAFSLAGRAEAEIRLDRQQLIEARLEVNADAACDRVEVVGWSTSKAAIYLSSAPVLGSRQVAGRTARAHSVGGSGLRQLVNEITPLETHARNLAQAELDWRKSSEVTLWARVAGNTKLRPGTPVELDGVAKPVAGRFVLTEVDHTVTEDGFFSEISSAPPEPTARPRGDVATIGIVTTVDDPEQLGRVRVRLPAYNDVQTDWIPQVLPSAGHKKGFVCLPDVDDRVLVLLARENPAQGVVLGGLYGEERVPDQQLLGDKGSSNRGKLFTWTTAAGQRITLNENGDLLRLENGAGAEIEMKGNEIVLKAGRIDFRRS